MWIRPGWAHVVAARSRREERARETVGRRAQRPSDGGAVPAGGRTAIGATAAESFYISGIAKIEDQLLILLDLDRALLSDALEQLSRRGSSTAAEIPEIAAVPAEADAA